MSSLPYVAPASRFCRAAAVDPAPAGGGAGQPGPWRLEEALGNGDGDAAHSRLEDLWPCSWKDMAQLEPQCYLPYSAAGKADHGECEENLVIYPMWRCASTDRTVSTKISETFSSEYSNQVAFVSCTYINGWLLETQVLEPQVVAKPPIASTCRKAQPKPRAATPDAC